MAASREAIIAGLRRAAAKGRVPTGRKPRVTDDEIRSVKGLGTKEAAERLGLSVRRLIIRRNRLEDADELAKGK